MKSNRVNYLMVGGFVLATLIGLVVVIALLTGRTGSADAYYAVYDNVTGIEYGTRVLYEGYPIGQVEEVTPIDDNGQVRFRVDVSVLEDWKIPVDSVAEITASGLLAAVTINLAAGTGPAALEPGDQIPSRESSNVLAAMSGLASEISRLTESDIKPLLASLTHTTSAVGDLLDKEGGALIGDLRGLTKEFAERAPEILTNLDDFTIKLNESADDLQQLLSKQNLETLDRVIADLSVATKNLTALSSEFQETQKTAARLLENLDTVISDNRLDVDRSVIDLRYTVESVARHIDTINQNLEGASRNMFEFSRQIRANPGILIGGTPPKDEAKP